MVSCYALVHCDIGKPDALVQRRREAVSAATGGVRGIRIPDSHFSRYCLDTN
jgi:hypothetical protein